MFFRKSANKGTQRRTKSSGDNELKELRVKARRRLIGALALVIAAFIVVPLLFDDPAPESNKTAMVVPAAPDSLPQDSPDESFNQNFSSLDADPISENGAAGTISVDEDPSLELGEHVTEGLPAASTDTPDDTVKAEQPEQQPEPKPKAEKPKTEASKPVEQPKPKVQEQRTDDGSIALALLEGKEPAANSNPKPVESGNYHLQVAAYTTEQDANTRRDALIKSGVSNAYVESGQSNGQTVYRLRVGPFGSKQAAQAAQTRLRALGYPNGLISAK